MQTTETRWRLTFRKTGRSRTFATLEEARKATIIAAEKHGTRWLCLQPKH